MNRTEFVQLHATCVTAFGAYIIEAEKTTQMLRECTAEPLTVTQRLKVMSQGIVENDTHLVYLGVRSILYKAARLGYGSSH
jgi:hypothetical protein